MEEEGLLTKSFDEIPQYRDIRAELLQHREKGHTLAVRKSCSVL